MRGKYGAKADRRREEEYEAKVRDLETQVAKLRLELTQTIHEKDILINQMRGAIVREAEKLSRTEIESNNDRAAAELTSCKKRHHDNAMKAIRIWQENDTSGGIAYETWITLSDLLGVTSSEYLEAEGSQDLTRADRRWKAKASDLDVGQAKAGAVHVFPKGWNS